MRGEFYQQLTNDLETARAEGLFKEERIITSAQQADITVADGSHVINFCANNYLGLANHPDLIAAAKAGMLRQSASTSAASRAAKRFAVCFILPPPYNNSRNASTAIRGRLMPANHAATRLLSTGRSPMSRPVCPFMANRKSLSFHRVWITQTGSRG